VKYIRTFENYTEEDSTFLHNGYNYDLNKLFELSKNIKPRQYLISDLDWILEYDTPDANRVKNCDINVPVLVTRSDNSLTVIDGLHRLVRSIELDKDTIMCKFIPNEMLDMCKIS
jgi:hypothetical protein